MKIISAYLLALLGGNTYPTTVDLEKILSSVGAEADDQKMQLFFSEIKGKDITELIASGREKLASVPSSGGVAAAAAPTSGDAVPAEEAKKEEKVEEKEESDDDMGFSLFD